jgi:hypothetical protein
MTEAKHVLAERDWHLARQLGKILRVQKQNTFHPSIEGLRGD